MEHLAYYAFVSGFIFSCVAAAAYVLTAVGSMTAYRPTATNAGNFTIPVTINLPGSADRFARFFLYASLAFLTLSIVSRAIAVDRPPIGNLWEYTIALGWGITLFTAIFERAFHESAIPAVMLPGAVLMMAIALLFFPSGIEPLVPALQSNRILGIHVTTMVMAYSSLSISFGASLLYVLQTSGSSESATLLKQPLVGSGVPPVSNTYGSGVSLVSNTLTATETRARAANTRRFARLPDAEALGEVAYWSVLVGFPLLTLGIALGAYWANRAWGRYWGWDPKETSAFITWLVYAGYLHARGLRGWEGKRAAYLLLGGYCAVLFTYFAVNFLISGLHSYAGV
jgi:cytochrome c-type biogenesis protein CcsB